MPILLKFTLVLALMSALCAARAAHADEARNAWSADDTYREAAYLTLHLIDWGQSRYIARHPYEYTVNPDSSVTIRELREPNAILGPHPSIGRVNTYFSATLVGHVMLMRWLSRDWREALQYLTIGVEFTAVSVNARFGIKMDF